VTVPIVLLAFAVSVASTVGDALTVETYTRPRDLIDGAALAPWSDNVRPTNPSPDRTFLAWRESGSSANCGLFEAVPSPRGRLD